MKDFSYQFLVRGTKQAEMSRVEIAQYKQMFGDSFAQHCLA